jgi:hypothetical protein
MTARREQGRTVVWRNLERPIRQLLSGETAIALNGDQLLRRHLPLNRGVSLLQLPLRKIAVNQMDIGQNCPG